MAHAFGELEKIEILAAGILHTCIQQSCIRRRETLLSRTASSLRSTSSFSTETGQTRDSTEDLEYLDVLVHMCGKMLYSDKGRKLVNQYFELMEELAEQPDLPSRVRSMLRDVTEYRRETGVLYKATITKDPMTIHQNRGDEDICGSCMPRGSREQRGTERHGDSRRGAQPHKLRGGLNDLMSAFNISNPSTDIISSHFDNFSFEIDDGHSYNHCRRSGEDSFRGQNNYNNRSKQAKPQVLKKRLMRPAPNGLFFKADQIKATPLPLNLEKRNHVSDSPSLPKWLLSHSRTVYIFIYLVAIYFCFHLAIILY